MRIDDVAVYLVSGRVIDLTKKVNPGKAEGPVDTGKRKYEIRPFSFPPGELMHNIEMESHISTHVEAPSHYVPVRYDRKAPDISELPLASFFGIAAFVDCRSLPPRTAIGPDVLAESGIREKDIVLIGGSPHQGDRRSFMTKEGAAYLVEKKIKMLGFDDTVYPEDPRLLPKDLKTYFTHDLMLTSDIPIIEGLANLEELRKPRFLFFGFPARMGGLESFPIRAVAIEGND